MWPLERYAISCTFACARIWVASARTRASMPSHASQPAISRTRQPASQRPAAAVNARGCGFRSNARAHVASTICRSLERDADRSPQPTSAEKPGKKTIQLQNAIAEWPSRGIARRTVRLRCGSSALRYLSLSLSHLRYGIGWKLYSQCGRMWMAVDFCNCHETRTRSQRRMPPLLVLTVASRH